MINMIRRRFLQLLAFSGADTVALKATGNGPARKVIYMVQGFSCITCAVGLDTMLRKQRGILSSISTYPEGKVTVCFDPDYVNEKNIREFIADTGFTVESEHVA
jgi:copper chaperone CopZ